MAEKQTKQDFSWVQCFYSK